MVLTGQMLGGRVVVVTGTAAPLGRGLADAMSVAGASVWEAAGRLSGRAEAEAAMAGAAGAFGPVDALVHAWVEPEAVEPVAFADIDDERFEAVWEATMRGTRWWLQAAQAAMAGRGGRIVVVISTAALSGAAGLVAYTAAAEGQRLLAKSAARQWGAEGIAVNCLAVAPELVVAGSTAAGDVSLAPA
ncbi:MAG: SDR family oxidoreductase, partial [Actinomycetota bacterium]|nr:SDR family oxidoreductase [Actinomycetota bacterium]